MVLKQNENVDKKNYLKNVLKEDFNFPKPVNDEQKPIIDFIKNNLLHKLVIVDGIAGTGKTYIVANCALKLIEMQKYERIIFTRIMSRDKEDEMGALPGDVNKKFGAWAAPLNQVINDFAKEKKDGSKPNIMNELLQKKIVEYVPFEYMQGMTFKNAFIIFDEAQSASFNKIEKFLTRIGDDSMVVMMGAFNQIDLEYHTKLECCENGKAVVRDKSGTIISHNPNIKTMSHYEYFCNKFERMNVPFIKKFTLKKCVRSVIAQLTTDFFDDKRKKDANNKTQIIYSNNRVLVSDSKETKEPTLFSNIVNFLKR